MQGSATHTPSSDRRRIGRRRDRQRRDTRERLFEAAILEFERVGVAAAQIDRIARAAGVVRGTFYFHFATKDDVLLELRRRNESEILERIAALRGRPSSLVDTLLRVNDAILEAHQQVGESGLLRDLLALYARWPVDPGEAGNERKDRDQHGLRSELAAHFASAQRQGQLRSDLEPSLMAELYLNSLLGFFTTLEGDALRAACGSLVDVLVKGLRA